MTTTKTELDDHADVRDSDDRPAANWCMALAERIRREVPDLEKS